MHAICSCLTYLKETEVSHGIASGWLKNLVRSEPLSANETNRETHLSLTTKPAEISHECFDLLVGSKTPGAAFRTL